MTTLKDIAERLSKESKVAIFSHARPDGDTVGSALALYSALGALGIKADVYCSDDIPDRLFYLDGVKEFKKEISGEYSAYFAIDCADEMRLGSFCDTFKAQKNTYNLDHHVSNTRYAKYNFVLDCSANCENTYELIKLLGVKIDEKTANALQTGIVTDTGCFRHKNVTPETLLISADLVKSGADLNKIYYYNFTMQSKERAKLYGITMQKIRYFDGGKIAIASVLQNDLILSGAKQDQTEGFIDFIMGIVGVEVGVCLLETEKNVFKVSFRSKSVNVSEIAGVFGGGGHMLASGCKLNGEYEEVVDKLVETIKRYIPV